MRWRLWIEKKKPQTNKHKIYNNKFYYNKRSKKPNSISMENRFIHRKALKVRQSFQSCRLASPLYQGGKNYWLICRKLHLFALICKCFFPIGCKSSICSLKIFYTIFELVHLRYLHLFACIYTVFSPLLYIISI